MKPHKKTAPREALPDSHLEVIDRLGFEVLWWRDTAIRVRRADGTEADEWLPGDLVHWTAKKFVRFERAREGNYDFDGYSPSVASQHGGRSSSVLVALAWFGWLEKQQSSVRRPGPPPKSPAYFVVVTDAADEGGPAVAMREDGRVHMLIGTRGADAPLPIEAARKICVALNASPEGRP